VFDPNTSIRVYCSVCHRPFITDDGYTVCSERCDRELERMYELDFDDDDDNDDF